MVDYCVRGLMISPRRLLFFFSFLASLASKLDEVFQLTFPYRFACCATTIKLDED